MNSVKIPPGLLHPQCASPRGRGEGRFYDRSAVVADPAHHSGHRRQASNMFVSQFFGMVFGCP